MLKSIRYDPKSLITSVNLSTPRAPLMVPINITELNLLDQMQLTKEQKDRLKKLKWANGEIVINFNIPKYKQLIYDIIVACLQANNFDVMVNEIEQLTSTSSPDPKILLNSSIFDEQYKIYQTEIYQSKTITDVVQGSVPCPNCGSYKTRVQQLQLRSADEPMTELGKCINCGTNWRKG